MRRVGWSIALFSIALTTTVVLVVGGLWIGSETSRFRRDAEQAAENQIAQRQISIRDRVEDVVDLVQAQSQGGETQLRNALRSRVENARAAAYAVIERYGATRSRDELIDLIASAFRPIRYDGGRGYLFMVGYDGTHVLHPAEPRLEGTNTGDLQDQTGVYVVREEIRAARNSSGGFVEGYWDNPMTGEVDRKLSFVRGIPELQILVGSGDYLSAHRRDVEDELRRTLERVPLDRDEYVFGGTYDGVSIVGPRTGDNMWDVQDSEGTFVVRELSFLAQAGGGFLEYYLPEATGLDPVRKVSYVQGLPELGWYMGIGFNRETAGVVANARRNETLDLLRSRLLVIIVSLFALIALGFAAAVVFARQFEHNIRRFVDFSGHAAADRRLIDVESLPFADFQELAVAINGMVERLRATVDEKQVLLQEIHHRVKNNLQIVTSILNLQEGSVRDAESEQVFAQLRHRVASMAMIHEQLYRSENLSSVAMGPYVDDLVRQLRSSYDDPGAPWQIETALDDLRLDLNRAIPLGLIVTELVSNSLKYGGPENHQRHLSVRLSAHEIPAEQGGENHVSLIVRDNGPGMDPALWEKSTGLGLTLVKSLAQQLKATVELSSGDGTRWRIDFVAPPKTARVAKK